MRFDSEKTEKVTLKQRTQTGTNEFNEPEYSWDAADTTIWAEFYEKHGKEGDSEGQILVVQDVRCKVRYRSSLDPNVTAAPEAKHRIVRGITTYDVESIVPVGRRKGFKLMLKRRDNQ